MNRKLILLPFASIAGAFTQMPFVSAHCPLCTIGAAAVAGGAAWMGVNHVVIGLFIGAFAMSLGYWIAKLIKKQYFPLQSLVIIAFSYLSTIIPLIPLLKSNYPLFISLYGDYGTWLNKTYLFNLFVIGSLLGGLIVVLGPWLSKKLTNLRSGKMIPYQGVLLTFSMLLLVGVLVQLGM
ncbi:hypothetical protein HYY69_03380 [Candidatus Woesearchaeota archaeon]|nr:hypothetical protein [Candidatus Woesearchaeota archaeon]